MSRIIVRGGNRLSGTIGTNGAKNAVLPIIAASILAAKGKSVIQDAPRLDDVETISKVLENMGIGIQTDGHSIYINAEHIESVEGNYKLINKMRASFLIMGPLLSRMGKATIPLPGGCAIGTRPIDQHLKGFEAMGAHITLKSKYIKTFVEGRLQGAKIYLNVPSVGATENIMMAGALAEGTTTIENPAREPEIVDLANFINAMGGKVRGAGTGVIRIEGVQTLQGAVHQVIPDRIEAGTYRMAAAATGGEVYIEGAIADHLNPVIAKMREMGVVIEEHENGIMVKSCHALKAVDVKTLPHPGFPTDMQAQMMVLLALSDGTSIVTETVFENRYMHVEELKKMNAAIKVEGRVAVVSGGTRLSGARVCATDLRAGAALIIAGLAADGVTEITGLEHIDRGYGDIVEQLQKLGADIVRLEEEPTRMEEQVVRRSAIQPSLA